MDINELKSGMLVRDGRTLLKISTVYPKYVTAQVLLEGRPLAAPPRTTVRSFDTDHIDLFFSPATKGQISTMDKVYGHG